MKVRTGTLKQYLFFIVALLVAGIPRAQNSITDSRIGFTITLPEHWVVDSSDGTHALFRDTTRTYTGLIAIRRYDFSSDTLITEADDWTRANFIAYFFVVDADPFSSVLFYDTVSSRQSEVPWSTEMYSAFYDQETSSDDIAEYVRFTAAGTYGYEIYAIGPLDDMNEHVGMYAAIVQGVDIFTSAEVIRTQPTPRRIRRGTTSIPRNERCDLLGRTITQSPLHTASRIITGHGFHSLLFR